MRYLFEAAKYIIGLMGDLPFLDHSCRPSGIFVDACVSENTFKMRLHAYM